MNLDMESGLPERSDARIHILFEGYAGDRVASSVTYVRDHSIKVIIDPGMVPRPESILEPLKLLGEDPASVTDVIFSHHHPDHTVNAALFPNARVHDHWAIYEGDAWTSRDADGYLLSPSIRLLATPGHTPQDITTIVRSDDDVIAFTHLWWSAEGPANDPYATDQQALKKGREKVVQLATLIVPGHGPAFTPDDSTPI